MKTLLLLFLATLALSASAKLGETREQIKARYGAETFAATNQFYTRVLYHYKDLAIYVMFVDGKSVEETFNGTKKRPEMNEAEAIALAESVTGQKGWALTTFAANTSFYKSGLLSMTLGPYGEDLKCVNITSPAAHQAYTKWGEADDAMRKQKIANEFGEKPPAKTPPK